MPPKILRSKGAPQLVGDFSNGGRKGSTSGTAGALRNEKRKAHVKISKRSRTYVWTCSLCNPESFRRVAYLEGDLVSRLVMGIAGVTTWLTEVISIVTTSP